MQVTNLNSLFINSLQPVIFKVLLYVMENQGATDVLPKEVT